MAEFYDISNWNEKPWFGTKGTRNKSVVENPETGISFYFKTSLFKPDKDYKYEFWSEIIASEIGHFLGFKVLRYDIAFHKTEMGCISEFMNTEGESELTEGIQYLTGYNNAYKPALKSSKGDYTFQFICEALKSFNFNSYIDEIIRIIIFDSLIGNGDRHQENWGIIIYSKEAIQTYHKEAKNKKYKYFHRLLLKMFGWIFENLPSLPNPLKIMFHSLMPNKFAPIYDSGSCLGRELRDAKVKQMLSDEKQILSYILKGTSEIHWKGKKVSHFELIKKISEKHPEIVKTEIQRIKSIYNESNISKIITDVDIKLPQDKGEFKLPEERKKLMIKMVSLRFKELSKLLD
jgi:hypothetical protein